MSEFLPEDVRKGLSAARAKKRRRRKHRLTIHAGEEVYPILRIFDAGFEIDEEAPGLRGLVDIFDGPRHLAQALIVATDEGDGVRRYEFKRNTRATDGPAADFARIEPEYEALLPPDA